MTTAKAKLQLSDIVVGEKYRGGKYISPGYLAGSIVTVVKKNRKTVSVEHPAYTPETFAVDPAYLEVIE